MKPKINLLQAFKELISSGRLLPEQTDVSAFEVDGHVFLAEALHRLRRHYYSCNSNDVDIWSRDCNTATEAEILTH